MEILYTLLGIIAVALGLLVYYRISRIKEDSPDLTTLIQTNHQLVSDRLQQQERTLRETLGEQQKNSTSAIHQLNERLAVIASAQQNLSELSSQVGQLQTVLDNKQARGAFGEHQLEQLIKDVLPTETYSFQHTLTTGRRVDCLLLFPHPPGPIAVDSKFPLESYRRIVQAKDEETRKLCRKAFSTDISRHLEDIANRYIVPGETADTALMFLPTETIFSEIHTYHDAVVRKGHQLHVYIVSPSTMWATLNTMRAILRDLRIQEQAGVIQKEAAEIAKDAERLNQRVTSLEKNYSQMVDEFRKIRISTDKITARAHNINMAEIDERSD
ncbi:MAG: DNA recombination protein RmuC [Acidiferrobacteraceae bacterium]|nr:DNA recombination protein RmuC [Acidiferrobacteraceae bacterium]|tara:strand:+ start:990 stop:1973 length:984 start_codon:yes stop_codon:yes gene_type:complete